MKTKSIVIYGAYGHTGQFVVAELLRRGYQPILSGRDEKKLHALAERFKNLKIRAASLDDATALRAALDGAEIVINCAGPFVDTSPALIAAALNAGAHYIDISAEQQPIAFAFEHFAEAARRANLLVLPGLAFYGALADLLATAAMGDWDFADEVIIATALDSWHPTRGTRLTGERNQGKRLRFAGGKLTPFDVASELAWDFPQPFGSQPMIELPLSESILIPRHLQISTLRAYINGKALHDIHDAATPPPIPADELGRSAQKFVMEAQLQRSADKRSDKQIDGTQSNATRRCRAAGQDIYFTTAPLVAQAADFILQGQTKATGVVSAGEAFDSRKFLTSLDAVKITFDATL